MLSINKQIEIKENELSAIRFQIRKTMNNENYYNGNSVSDELVKYVYELTEIESTMISTIEYLKTLKH